MTPVAFHFVTPNGLPVANTAVEIQLSKPGFDDLVNGVVMPRLVLATTDADGKATVDLWPSSIMYFVQVYDSVSDAGLFYKFYVPKVDVPGTVVRLQDIVVDSAMSGTTYDEAAFLLIHNAKSITLAYSADAAESKRLSRISELASGLSANQTATVYAAMQEALVSQAIITANAQATLLSAFAVIPEDLINPMTSMGDMLVGGVSGAVTRLGAGLTGQVLTSDGPGAVPVWKQSLAGGMSATDQAKLNAINGTNTGDQVIPTTLPASDVYVWAKAATKPTYTLTELGAQPAGNYATGGGSASGVNTADETAATIKTKLGISILSGDNRGDQFIPTTLPASDVYSWAKASTKPTYTLTELGAQPAGSYATGTGSATNTNTGDQVIPTTLPASDVYAWAKAATKPGYTLTELGAQAAGNYATGGGTATGNNSGDQVASSTVPTAPGTAAVGTLVTFARGDHIHPLQTDVSGTSGSTNALKGVIVSAVAPVTGQVFTATSPTGGSWQTPAAGGSAAPLKFTESSSSLSLSVPRGLEDVTVHSIGVTNPNPVDSCNFTSGSVSTDGVSPFNDMRRLRAVAIAGATATVSRAAGFMMSGPLGRPRTRDIWPSIGYASIDDANTGGTYINGVFNTGSAGIMTVEPNSNLGNRRVCIAMNSNQGNLFMHSYGPNGISTLIDLGATNFGRAQFVMFGFACWVSDDGATLYGQAYNCNTRVASAVYSFPVGDTAPISTDNMFHGVGRASMAGAFQAQLGWAGFYSGKWMGQIGS